MRRTLVAVVVMTSLFAGQTSLLRAVWSYLSTSTWNGATAEACCGADPNGLCNPAPKPTADEGCGADPNGKCNPQR
jgi:hypothetical protein